ncbi:hypothetical protein ACNKHT_18195 [Shigella flexneri]
MIAREAENMGLISVCAVKWRAIPCAWHPHWAWVSPSVYERTFCSAGKYLPRRIDYAEAENLAQRSLEAQLVTEVRHQVAAFMERRGMAG